ncbi:MAG: DNA repair protein RecO [bacterium]
MAEETMRLNAIILDRKPFRENDLLVTIYSKERGREQLIARGARKFRSKIAAHVEPFCLIEGLLIVGKNKNYLGSAISTNVFAYLKRDLAALSSAASAFKVFERFIKENQADEQLYDLVVDFLTTINQPGVNFAFLSLGFKWKMCAILGFAIAPEHLTKNPEYANVLKLLNESTFEKIVNIPAVDLDKLDKLVQININQGGGK